MTHSMKKVLLASAISASGILAASPAYSFSFNEFVKEGDLIAQLRGRSESVTQDNDKEDASAQTVRARIGYETADIAGFKVLTEFDHVQALGEEYGKHPNTRIEPSADNTSVVADPATTDINRALISYSLNDVTATAGRQRIIFDNARFIGNVGWRQNEQTYDAIRLDYSGIDKLKVSYAFVDQVNDIFFRDVDTSSHFLNASYSGLAAGKISSYGYLLKFDDSEATNNTFGVRFKGKTALDGLDLLYTAELATQTANSGADGAEDTDASYNFLEGGIKVSGVSLLAGYEKLGGDGDYAFTTPHATGHAFNGWTDQFLGTPGKGLQDIYAKAVTKVAGVKLLAMYHDFSSDKDGDDLGSEINLLAAKKFAKNYTAGIKYANYSATDEAGKVDTDKLWIWAEAKF